MQWIIFHGLLDFASNTKLGDHDTSNFHNTCFIITYGVEGPTWIEGYEIAFGWEPCMSLHYTWRPMTTQILILICHVIAFAWVSKGPYKFKVTALGHSVWWPLSSKEMNSVSLDESQANQFWLWCRDARLWCLSMEIQIHIQAMVQEWIVEELQIMQEGTKKCQHH